MASFPRLERAHFSSLQLRQASGLIAPVEVDLELEHGALEVGLEPHFEVAELEPEDEAVALEQPLGPTGQLRVVSDFA